MSARWGNNANGYVEFVCQPPWVNLSPYEPYFRSHLEEVCAPQGPSDQGCVPTVSHAEHLRVFDQQPRFTEAEPGASVTAGLDLGAATTRVHKDVVSAVPGGVLDAPGLDVDTPSVLDPPLFFLLATPSVFDAPDLELATPGVACTSVPRAGECLFRQYPL